MPAGFVEAAHKVSRSRRDCWRSQQDPKGLLSQIAGLVETAHEVSRTQYCWLCQQVSQRLLSSIAGFIEAAHKVSRTVFYFIKINSHRRCMAVVSPWCIAVFALNCVSYGQLPCQIILYIFSGGIVFIFYSLIRVHVKSSWPTYIGIHLCYNRIYKILHSFQKKIAKFKIFFFRIFLCNSRK